MKIYGFNNVSNIASKAVWEHTNLKHFKMQ